LTLEEPTDPLRLPSLFSTLDAERRDLLIRSMRRRDLTRGEILVSEGDPSGSLFVVLHGAFEVHRADNPVPIAEIRSGELIGEIGFLAGTARTATVKALRDASVLELDRASYDRITHEAPQILGSIMAALALRLANTSARLPQVRALARARTVTVVANDVEPLPPVFWTSLRQALGSLGAVVVDNAMIESRFGTASPDEQRVTEWLNGLEQQAGTIVYFGSPGLTDWTMKAIRQADLVLIAVQGDTPPASLTDVERFVADIHEPAARRLVRLHDSRVEVTSGTARWLDRLEVFMHHHVALQDDLDFRSLARFVTGRAIGLIAGGGGGFGPAHVGVFRAFSEIGVEFDIFGGTSVGAAMLAGFCRRVDADRLDLGTHRIFVTSRSFKRPTWPRYALLDHKAFDAALQFEYGQTTLIEDCWRPFFAAATNLSTQRLDLIRRGEVWRAVRASSAIPGLLPPVYTKDGMMLVDGGLMDNAPVGPMRDLKIGPNVVVHFGKRGTQLFKVDYDALPGRGKLIADMLNPFARLPRAPSATSVLWRSLLAHQRYDMALDPQDMELCPPGVPGTTVVDFSNHNKVYMAGYEWTKAQLAKRSVQGDPALTAILDASGLS